MPKQATDVLEVIRTGRTFILIIVVPTMSIMFILEALESPFADHAAGNTRSKNITLQVIEYRRIKREFFGTSVTPFRSRQMRLQML